MKKLLLPIFSLVCGFSFGQVIVSEPLIVADQETYGNLRPRVVSDSNGDPVIIWSDANTHSVFATHMMGGSFMDPVQINPTESHAAVYDWYGPDVAIDGNHVYVVYKELPENTGDIFLVHSSNGGMSWGAPMLVSSTDEPAVRMPDVAVATDGTVYVTFMKEYYDTMATEWVLTKSQDQGQTFSTPISATSSVVGTVCDCCPADLLAYGDNVAIIYRNNDNNLRDIRAAVSIDNGSTFNTFVDLDPLDWEISACPASGANAVATSEGMQAVWMSDATGDSRIYFSEHGYYSGSDVEAEELHITEANETQNYPSLAIDQDSKLVAWEVNTSGQRNIAITWAFDNFDIQEYMILTEEESGNQQRPNLSSAGSLGYHLVYSDNGGDALIYRFVDLTTGVNDNSDFGTTLEIFPNPATNSVSISIPYGNSTLHVLNIYSSESRLIYSKTVGSQNGVLQLSLSDLKAGMYILELDGCRSKLIVE